MSLMEKREQKRMRDRFARTLLGGSKCARGMCEAYPDCTSARKFAVEPPVMVGLDF